MALKFKSISHTPLPPKPSPLTANNCNASTPTAYANITTLYNDSDSGVGYKQWSIWNEPHDDQIVTTSWGKVGGTLQRNSKRYYSAWKARHAMLDTIEKKRTKGYRNTL